MTAALCETSKVEGELAHLNTSTHDVLKDMMLNNHLEFIKVRWTVRDT